MGTKVGIVVDSRKFGGVCAHWIRTSERGKLDSYGGADRAAQLQQPRWRPASKRESNTIHIGLADGNH
eukprot:8869231-Pyramimonas_sp.AAC.1